MRIRAQSLDAVRSLGTVSPLSISVLLRPRPSLRAGVTEARSSAPTRPEATRVAASALLGIREDSPSRCMTRCMRVAQNARLKRLCLRATSRRTRTWAHDAATSTKEDIVTTENTSSGTTAALVIVESYFGSTRTIAEAIAAGLSETGAQARVLDVDRAPDVLPADLDRLVLGAPTHNRGLPTAGTRATACKKQGATTSATGVREWLAAVPIPASTRVAAFDTVVGRNWLPRRSPRRCDARAEASQPSRASSSRRARAPWATARRRRPATGGVSWPRHRRHPAGSADIGDLHRQLPGYGDARDTARLRPDRRPRRLADHQTPEVSSRERTSRGSAERRAPPGAATRHRARHGRMLRRPSGSRAGQ